MAVMRDGLGGTTRGGSMPQQRGLEGPSYLSTHTFLYHQQGL